MAFLYWQFLLGCQYCRIYGRRKAIAGSSRIFRGEATTTLMLYFMNVPALHGSSTTAISTAAWTSCKLEYFSRHFHFDTYTPRNECTCSMYFIRLSLDTG